MLFANAFHLLHQGAVGSGGTSVRLMPENALVRCADLCQPHGGRNDSFQHRQVFAEILFDPGHDVSAEVRVIGHRQEYAANFQLGVDLLTDALHRAHKLRHILGGQIVRLHGDEHIVRSRQGVDDQHPQRRAAVQQHIVVTSLDALQIALEHGFPTHNIDQPHLYRRQSTVGGNEVKALRVVQNFRMLRPALVLHDGVHLLG